ncbi:VRR-NUC domain-containing protein [Roridomyces roridus]|uniref:Fanconi-associated nuclease n=1 Tax=Roridomyces roridus TaxID=1738132 RepID=A0AAD7CFV9_9AGAR|nr:VRR-NUC domain-containing protein [Roridomyces roridus]
MAQTLRDQLFGIGDHVDEESIDDAERNRDTEASSTDNCKVWTKESLYVEVFERAINNIGRYETRLFTAEEWDYIQAIRNLEYHSRFLLFRLVLRVPGWHRISNFRRYISEVGEDGLKAAFKQLCDPCGPEIIDLTDDEPAPSFAYFCQGQDQLELADGLRLLLVDELKGLCKTFCVQPKKMTKDMMITALINNANSQSTLSFGPVSNGKGKNKAPEGKLRQTTLPYAASPRKQTETLRQSMLTLVEQPIRLNPYLRTLFMRLDIIWFRQTHYPESLFTMALLCGFNKRTYATYEHVRDPDIWSTREEYLLYETGLQVEAAVDDLLKQEPASKAGADAPSALKKWKDLIRRLIRPSDEEDNDATPAHQKARIVTQILQQHAMPMWEKLLAAESARTTPRRSGLERFEPGYVYTRIVRKCSKALATLKEFASEKEVLDKLLEQRHWRRGSRAKWYDRRALVLTKHLYKDNKNTDLLREARVGLRAALKDDDTATVLRPSLIARLVQVEKWLKLPDAEKTYCDDAALKKPEEVSFHAIRVWDEGVKIDARGKIKGKENKTADITRHFAFREEPELKKTVSSPRWKGKSLWQGRDGTCNVETRAIQYYEEQGFKGIHSETQILTTLFGLLFWDIIFLPIPGAFETPWQTGPLDIGEDSFYNARRDPINRRLEEIRSGRARAKLEEHDDRYREAKTCCIGVNWDLCGREEMVEIVECLGGEPLAAICQLFCEDYGGRCSGVPDLVLWNMETKECKFVEVKGPGDGLSENQKLWSHALLTARCAVDLCWVLDKNGKKKVSAKKTVKPRRQSRASTSRTKLTIRTPSVGPESEDEEAMVQDLEEGDSWEPSSAPPPLLGSKQRPFEIDDDDDPPTKLRKRPGTNFPTPPAKKVKNS